MNNWEYKLSEFTGSADAFQAWLNQEKTEAWELGALLPGQSKRNASPSASPITASPATSICIIFKRQTAVLPAAPTFF